MGVKRRARVYIAGPLNAMAVDYLKNVHCMMRKAEEVRRLGYAVYVPAIDLLMGIMFGDYGYEDYFENSQPFLDVCDVMFVCEGWDKSNGTLKEIDRARSKGIPRCFDVADLLDIIPPFVDEVA